MDELPELNETHFGPGGKSVLNPGNVDMVNKILAIFYDFQRDQTTRINENDTYANTLKRIESGEAKVIPIPTSALQKTPMEDTEIENWMQH